MLFVTLLLHYRNNSALPLPSSLTIARASVLAARCCASVRPMLSWVSVCLSVRLSITFVDFVKTSNRILRLFHRRVAAPFWFLHTKPYGDIPTKTGASNAGGVCKNRDSRRISGYRIDDWWTANNCDGPPCSLPHRRRRISESCVSQPAAWTTTTKRTKQNRI